jgi:hypothetical protein
VTLKKPVRASVQVFSGRTTEPVWFLKLCYEEEDAEASRQLSVDLLEEE